MPQCPRCSKAVYAAEQVTGPNGTFFHKACMKCKECSKGLDSTTVTEKQGEVYCKSCYGKLFGPKGYGYGGGAGVLSTDSTITAGPNYVATTASNSSLNNDGSPAGRPAGFRDEIKQLASSNGSIAGGSNNNLAGSTSSLKKIGGSSDRCPRCDKAVYFAEQMLGPGGIKYHKTCMKCTDCNKSVDSTTMADKDKVLYCKPCYGRKFGPKGYDKPR